MKKLPQNTEREEAGIHKYLSYSIPDSPIPVTFC